MHCFRLLILCFLSVTDVDAGKAQPKIAVPNWFNHKTLGIGKHAAPQLKHAAGKALRNMRSLIREKVLVKGENWKTKFAKAHAVTQCVGFLMGISYWTVQRSVTFLQERNAHSTLPEPATRGRKQMTTKQYQDAYGTVYNAILRHLKDAKKSGETIDVDKLLLLLREEEQINFHIFQTCSEYNYFGISLAMRRALRDNRCKFHFRDEVNTNNNPQTHVLFSLGLTEKHEKHVYVVKNMEKTDIGGVRQAGICPRVPVPPPLRWSRKHHHRRHIEHTFF